MLKKIIKLLHIHFWHNEMNTGLYAEGWDEFYRCRCGAIKRKYMNKDEEIIESKGE